MNKTTEALKLAEEALSFYVEDFDCAADVIALATIREVLAQPVKQEPVAWWNGKETAWFEHELCGWQAPDGCTIPLYAAPVERQWVDLTDDEILECAPINGATVESVAIAVAAKLKEKNTPPVVPQGEPVAWRYKHEGMWLFSENDFPSTDEQVREPLYTTPPSVEAAIERERLMGYATAQMAVEAMRIETLEKAAKVCEAQDLFVGSGICAAAIRSME